jgi:hypothetical protein
MADEIALGFIGDFKEPYWMFIRSTEKHSGNFNNLSRAFERFLVEGREQPIGYYGDRLDNLKLVAGKSLIKWSEE